MVEKDREGRKRWVRRDRSRTIADMAEHNLDELVEKYHAVRTPLFRQWYTHTGLDKDGFDKTPAWRELTSRVDLAVLNHSKTA